MLRLILRERGLHTVHELIAPEAQESIRLGLDVEEVLICSTGVIGVPIPMPTLLAPRAFALALGCALRLVGGSLRFGDLRSRWLRKCRRNSWPPTVSVLAAMIWAIENPNAGVVEPEDIDERRILEISTPYLGTMAGYWTNWTPLQDRETLFPEDGLQPSWPAGGGTAHGGEAREAEVAVWVSSVRESESEGSEVNLPCARGTALA